MRLLLRVYTLQVRYGTMSISMIRADCMARIQPDILADLARYTG